MTLIEGFLVFAFRAGTGKASLYSFLAGLSCGNLGFGQINSLKRFGNLGILQFALAKVVVYRGPCCRDGRIRLVNLRLVIFVFQFNDQVPFVHLLIVRDVYCANDTGNLGAEWSEIASDVGVVSDLVDSPALPGIPISGEGDDQNGSEEEYSYGREIAEPLRLGGGRPWALRSKRVKRRRLRHGEPRCRVRGYRGHKASRLRD